MIIAMASRHSRLSGPFPRRLPVLYPFLHLLILLLSISNLPPALADCECGYLATINNLPSAFTVSNHHHHNNNNSTDNSNPRHGGSPAATTALFTDLLETDFTRFKPGTGAVADPLFKDTDWAPQAFNLTRERARGEYGETFAVENVRVAEDAGPGSGHDGGGGQQQEEGTALHLVVRSEVVDGMVPVAELDTRRLDLMWGSFRAVMRVSDVEGTCAAFFWYFNDTQEIDMEFLSKDFNRANNSFPVDLVLQSREAAMAGYDAAKTGNFVKVNLPFDPTEGFHEYRIDYLPGRVFFYADGATLAEMDGPAVPSSPGHLILQHWSNGNRYWSGGPPVEDAALVVKYVKAYFNSSMEHRQRDWEDRCRDPTAPGAVCRIPDVTPGNLSAAGWFFMDQGNMTNNQTVSEQNRGFPSKNMWSSVMMAVVLLAAGGLVVL